MHIDQQPYRRLYDEVMEYEGDALYDDLLRPWLAGADGERRWLDGLRARTGHPVPAVSQEESWRLYALSRIVQLLQLSFAPRDAGTGPNVAPVTADQYARFMEALGMETVDELAFHPFHHEVVTVDPAADDGEPPRIAEVYWPGHRVGPLLVTRAGCRVSAGRRHLVKEIAERSVLYWASARAHRPRADLGDGWGSSSRWRTPFRRDYALDGARHYNVDARPGGRPADDGLDERERAELLRHRCFVTCAKPSDDLWPYDLSMVEPA